MALLFKVLFLSLFMLVTSSSSRIDVSVTSPATRRFCHGDTIRLECQYNLPERPEALQWTFNQDIPMFRHGFGDHPHGVQPRYHGRLCAPSPVSPSSHTIHLEGFDFCTDVGMYGCTVWGHNTPAHTGQLHVAAHPCNEMFLRDEVNYHKRKKFAEPAHGIISCSASWAHDLKIRFKTDTMEESISGHSPHNNTCPYHAAVRTPYNVSYGESMEYSCLIQYGDIGLNKSYRGGITVDIKHNEARKMESGCGLLVYTFMTISTIILSYKHF